MTTFSGEIRFTNIPCDCGAKVIVMGRCPSCGKYRESALNYNDPESNVPLSSCITVGECPRCGGNITKYVCNADSIATCEMCFKQYKIFLKEVEN